MANKADELHLWRRDYTNVYSLRLAVPPSLRNHPALKAAPDGAPRGTIVEPLGTGDLKQAQMLRNRRLPYWYSLFARLRAGEPVTADEVIAERKRFANQCKALRQSLPHYFHQYFYDTFTAHPDPTVREALQRQVPLAAAIATAFEEYEGPPILPGGPLDKPKPGVEPPPTPVLVDPPPRSTPQAPPKLAPSVATNNGNGTITSNPLFSQALDLYLADRQRKRASIRPATLAGYRQKGKAFLDYAGDARLGDIAHEQATAFLDGLAKEPATVNGYAALLKAVFDYARKPPIRYRGENPFEDQKREVETESYPSFKADEVRAMFEAAAPSIKPKGHSTATALPWIIRIAAYSGMRREEISQMRWCDLRKEEGVWVFDVTKAAGRLKTKSSARIVPVHSALIEAGLFKYHAALERGGRLFPGLKQRASKGTFGAAIGDAFENFRKRLGIVREGVCFHSFRETFITLLDRAGVAESDIHRLVGHEVNGMSLGTYSDGPGPVRLQQIVEKIKY